MGRSRRTTPITLTRSRPGSNTTKPAVAWSSEVARLAREHNDANVLILPARFLSEAEGVEILKTWLETAYAGGRHERRVAKIERE
jgi:ribose 5-phosphate isomerase B